MKRRPHRRKPRPAAPLDVQLTVRFRFGPEPADHITMLDAQRIPLVDSVFTQRDRILRGFVLLLLQGGLRSPAVLKEFLPFAGRRR